MDSWCVCVRALAAIRAPLLAMPQRRRLTQRGLGGARRQRIEKGVARALRPFSIRWQVDACSRE